MSKKLFVTLTITIPDDPFTAAHVYTAMQPAWEKLLEALKESGTEYDAKFSELEQRTRAARKPRKPRLVATGDAA
jgi:nucleoid DNA-binding protein